jgi:hypothetical protein
MSALKVGSSVFVRPAMNQDVIELNLVSHAEAIADMESRLAAIESMLAAPKPPSMILNWNTLSDLPVDLAEAVEQAKLAIIRHRADKWSQAPQQTFIEVFKALGEMAASQDGK